MVNRQITDLGKQKINRMFFGLTATIKIKIVMAITVRVGKAILTDFDVHVPTKDKNTMNAILKNVE